MILNLLSAPDEEGTVAQCKNRARPIATKRTLPFVFRMISPQRSERVRPVRAHHEKKLKQELVGVGETSVGNVPQMSVAVLATNLAKLAGPVREDTRKTCVRLVGVGGSSASVEAASRRPTAGGGGVCGPGKPPKGVWFLKTGGGEGVRGGPKKKPWWKGKKGERARARGLKRHEVAAVEGLGGE